MKMVKDTERSEVMLGEQRKAAFWTTPITGCREREKAYLSEASLYIAELSITVLSVG